MLSTSILNLIIYKNHSLISYRNFIIIFWEISLQTEGDIDTLPLYKTHPFFPGEEKNKWCWIVQNLFSHPCQYIASQLQSHPFCLLHGKRGEPLIVLWQLGCWALSVEGLRGHWRRSFFFLVLVCPFVVLVLFLQRGWLFVAMSPIAPSKSPEQTGV